MELIKVSRVILVQVNIDINFHRLVFHVGSVPRGLWVMCLEAAMSHRWAAAALPKVRESAALQHMNGVTLVVLVFRTISSCSVQPECS